jgi:hypothetical protein
MDDGSASAAVAEPGAAAYLEDAYGYEVELVAAAG